MSVDETRRSHEGHETGGRDDRAPEGVLPLAVGMMLAGLGALVSASAPGAGLAVALLGGAVVAAGAVRTIGGRG